MNSRERWEATLNGKPRDRIATDIWATPEVFAKLQNHFGCSTDDQVRSKLGIDKLHGVKLPYTGPELPPDTDFWGVKLQRINYGDGEYTEVAEAPLATATTVADIERHPWPAPDWLNESDITQQIDGFDDSRLILTGDYEPFLLYCRIRGMEQAYMDLATEPAIAEAILTHIFDFFYERNRKVFEAGRGRIGLFCLAEDLGGQHGPLFSLDIYKRFLLPNQEKMAALARRHGARVSYHSDGAMRPFLPLLIDRVGIDILNPLQWRCPGMELPALVRDFGKHIAFHGGIDNQETLPFGSPEDVREEVRWMAHVMENARWICAPCHNIQPNTPPANVVAMYEAIQSIETKIS